MRGLHGLQATRTEAADFERPVASAPSLDPGSAPTPPPAPQPALASPPSGERDVATSPPGRLRRWWESRAGASLLLEIAICAALLFIYKAARLVAQGDVGVALRNAQKVIDLERALGVFNEGAMQELVLQSVPMVKFLNSYYLYAHFTVTIAFLGPLRDLAGTETMEVPAPLDWDMLLSAVGPEIAGQLTEARVNVACAGKVLADKTTLLAQDGDEVALLPPVSGG